MKTMSKIRYEDWVYDYKYKNRFAYIGNGTVYADMLPKSERLERLVPYIRISETPWNIE